MRKIMLMMLVVTMIATSFTFNAEVAEASSPFPDMPNSGHDTINRLVKDGILVGSPDGKLNPGQTVTRGEAITMIGRALKLDGTQRQTKFTDVSRSHYASGYIATGSEMGLIAGRTSTTFDPSGHVTRAEMAVFLQRAFNLTRTRTDVIYRDVNANTFGSNAINAITTAGVSVGYPDGSFKPTNGTTRLEYILFLGRALYPELKLPEYQPNPDVLEQFATKAVVFNAPSGLNVRSGAGTQYPSIGRLANGTEVNYYNVVGNWAAFTYNGEIAYVSLSYLRTPSTGGSGSLAGKTIVVDAGHGGHDPGAVAASNGLREKDFNLAVALKLQRRLEAAGARVIMTRTTDVFLTLTERANIANRNNADAFISIHANAGPSSANGSETFWNRNHASADSKRLAESIQSEMIAKLNTRNRGVKEGNFTVIQTSRMASVLVEVGFLSNAEEARKLASNSFQEDAAEAIFQGTVKYFR
ncbi:N-acetylmuramoyl-L-alanine amidase [Alkalihalophilus marmarensis]|uniref:N-acetylmuramoyl-L-alanine amidase n=1 Tax=Alkalihalophilus marmarensis DSM 21297 TaxID=1188261 RepID=U6SK89_9BACI|nr:N-acetylmuramoyl-L-alanine amidase [Alkalihalophilus marmarensis]ERN51802.1 N-acetylmuramoyl-L-alanine amidase [Alkalihalophilus marmarensis DSM 21297]